MASKQPTPRIFVHPPAKSVKQAIGNANQHVAAVHAAAKSKGDSGK